MSQGCFEVERNQENRFDIIMNFIPEYVKDGIPEKQEELYVEIEKTTSILESLHNTSNEIKEKYFKKLESLADAGLTGPDAQPELALKSLEALKQEVVVNEGSRIKNNYMIYLGISAIVMIVICIVLIRILKSSELKYIYTFVGTMPGAWISFGARKMDLSFEELSVIENDKINPPIRLIFIGITAMILMLFIDVDIISISFGGFNTDSIDTSINNQLFLGVACGLVESRLAIGIFNKANNIIDL